ncbi:MAG: aminodeoxychorismate synthase component I [Arenicella sp.]|jgi:para-aminobenzoate synthetase component 1|nr:aminodeoxychorismate synthase component I [Arenicella sp.]HAU68756.1 aminodeoxychorismate synthase component I [Gammaproteobacteria bacterium]
MKITTKTYPYVDSEQLFTSVADGEWSMYLDSGVTAHNSHLRRKHADYDVLASQPVATLVHEHGKTTIERTNEASSSQARYSEDSPLDLLRGLLGELKADIPQEKPAYLPGLIGYLSYDFARSIESISSLASDDEGLPEVAMGLFPVVVVVDHVCEETSIVFCEGYPNVDVLVAQWASRITQVAARADSEQAFFDETRPCNTWIAEEISSKLDFAGYKERFNKVQRYIQAGDCYQVNLTKRFSAKVEGNAWSTYLKLRRSSPAPYAAFLKLPFATVLSNSPESFIECHDQQVVTSPIKGTRPRDHRSKFKDRMAADALLNSTKDRAENLMIVDLMRNDLSRCCDLGTVKVPKLFALHSFANVHHLISTVVGRLRADLDVFDLINNCFPGGSITGAPKIRSMEIIEELEPCRRGLYCGSIGYLGVDGSLETNIAIRTMVLKDDVVRFSAGGGLVLDSIAEDEFQELNDKASMMSNVITLG